MKNGQLNFGVVAPPDKLPNASLHDTIYPNGEPKKTGSSSQMPNFKAGTSKMTAGKASAGCAILGMALSFLSLLPFIRKR